MLKVKRMQRSGTEATRTINQPSKPKREITNITNSQNTKRIYGQPSDQPFPKRWPFEDDQISLGHVTIKMIGFNPISIEVPFFFFSFRKTIILFFNRLIFIPVLN